LAVPSQPQSGDPPPPTTPPVRWTVLEIVRWTTTRFSQRGLASPRLDAEILAAHALGMSRVQLYVQYDRPLEVAELAGMRELVKRRQAGESVAYIIGKKEFFGHRAGRRCARAGPAPRHRDAGRRGACAARGGA
jgi:methylase of polypeptide subunit release factors